MSSENVEESSPKKITLVLSEYLEDLWCGRGRCQVTLDKGKLISTIDSEELYCHVEFPSVDRPVTIVWRLRDWKESQTKAAKDKERSAREQKEWSRFKDNMYLAVNYLHKLSGADKKFLIQTAYRMLKKNPKVLLANEVKILPPYVPTTLVPVEIIFEEMTIELNNNQSENK